MAHMTKAQARRMLKSIDSKAKRLWTVPQKNIASTTASVMSTPDVIAIEKIVARCLKRLG